ncbi:MAG: ABC transporter ATP-binding protein [Actinomycetota bacterium]
MIDVRSLTFRYPAAARDALDDVTLSIDDAAFVVVAGDSGSGKSTFVHAICGLVPHFTGGTFSGSVTIAGRDTRTQAPRDLADVAGFVAQDPTAQSVVDRVEDEIVFAMENLGVDPTIMRKRLEEVLDATAIAPLRERRLQTLSGGERQRLAIAAVLAAQPRVLLLDEPTSQLDPQSAEEVLGVLQRLNADLGLTIVLVEHRLERVVQHADTMIVLADGRVVAHGSPRAVLSSGAATTPLSSLARALGWNPMPLTVREGRAFAASMAVGPRLAAHPSPSRPLVEARNLRVALGGRDVLRGVDLTACAGETVAIVGRNGSGKTTLVRALVGLVRARTGSVSIVDFDPARDAVERIAARVAYVPQSADSILFHETVRDEIRFTLRSRSATEDPDDVIARAGLEAFAALDPRDLSAGERLRVALLAATAGAPDVILLDEPTRGMDARGKDELARVVDAWRSEGRATVIVSHDVELVARVATRVVMIAEGSVVVDGPVREVLGESALFSSQMNKVFGDRRILTIDDALEAIR